MKKSLSKGIFTIPGSSLNPTQMNPIVGGKRQPTSVEGGACCICSPGLANSANGANEAARH